MYRSVACYFMALFCFSSVLPLNLAQDCSPFADVVFVIRDSSLRYIKNTNILSSMSNFIPRLMIGQSSIRLSFITYARLSTIQIAFISSSAQTNLLANINGIRSTYSGDESLINMTSGLSLARAVLFDSSQPGYRNGANKIIVILTDSVTDLYTIENIETPEGASLADDEVTIYTIAVDAGSPAPCAREAGLVDDKEYHVKQNYYLTSDLSCMTFALNWLVSKMCSSIFTATTILSTAFSVNSVFTTSSSSGGPTQATTDCSPFADVVFVVRDSSLRYIKNTNILSSMSNFIPRFIIDQSSIRLSFITYAHLSTIQIAFISSSAQTNLLANINGIRSTYSGDESLINMTSGLSLARAVLFDSSQPGYRNGANKIIVILTDFYTDLYTIENNENPEGASLADDGVTIYTIAVDTGSSAPCGEEDQVTSDHYLTSDLSCTTYALNWLASKLCSSIFTAATILSRAFSMDPVFTTRSSPGVYIPSTTGAPTQATTVSTWNKNSVDLGIGLGVGLSVPLAAFIFVVIIVCRQRKGASWLEETTENPPKYERSVSNSVIEEMTIYDELTTYTALQLSEINTCDNVPDGIAKDTNPSKSRYTNEPSVLAGNSVPRPDTKELYENSPGDVIHDPADANVDEIDQDYLAPSVYID